MKWTLIILNDNQGVIALVKNSVHHNAWKYIEILYHFIWDCITEGKLCLEKVFMVDNVTDVITL
jgi:hypothetical protein